MKWLFVLLSIDVIFRSLVVEGHRFMKSGVVVPNVDFGHLRVGVDGTVLYDAARTLQTRALELNFETSRIEVMITRIEARLRIMDPEESWKDDSRVKRWLAPLAFVLGAFGLDHLFGSSSDTELATRISEDEDQWADITHDYELKLKECARSIAALNSLALKVWTRMVRMEKVDVLREFIGVLEMRTDIFCGIFDGAMNGLVSPDLVGLDRIKNSMNRINEKANKIGLMTLPFDPRDIYQLEFTVRFYQRKLLVVILHVPLSKEDGIFQLWKYVGSPMAYDKGRILEVKNDNYYVGVSKDNSALIPFEGEEIGECRQVGVVKLCHRRVVNGNTVKTCPEALYRGNLDQIVKRCPLKIRGLEDLTVQLTMTRFMIGSKSMRRGIETCKRSKKSIELNQGLNELVVMKDCSVKFDNLEIERGPQIIYEEDYKLPMGNFSEMMRLLDLDDVDLDGVEWPKDIDVSHLRAFKPKGIFHHVSSRLNAGLWIGFLGVLLIGFLVWRLRKRIAGSKVVKFGQTKDRHVKEFTKEGVPIDDGINESIERFER